MGDVATEALGEVLRGHVHGGANEHEVVRDRDLGVLHDEVGLYLHVVLPKHVEPLGATLLDTSRFEVDDEVPSRLGLGFRLRFELLLFDLRCSGQFLLLWGGATKQLILP